MKLRGVFTVEGDHLVPADDAALEVLRSVRKGQKKRNPGCLVNIHVPRNIKHHRMLFGLLNLVIDAGAWEGSIDTLLAWCKIATGHVDTIVDHKGRTGYVPRSIAFESMDQTEFSTFFDKALNEVCSKLLNGADKKAVLNEITSAMDAGYSEMARF